MLDIAVIGSGMSGSAVAAELERAGRDYVVLEAGADRGRAHTAADPRSADLADPARDPSFVPFLTRPGTVYGPLSGYRERLGGRSLYWRGICIRVEDQALADWPAEVRHALLGATGTPGLYDEIEALLREWSDGTPLTRARTATEKEMTGELGRLGYPAVPTPRAVRDLGEGRWDAYSPVAALPAGRFLTGHRVSAVRELPGGGFSLALQGGERPALVARRVVLCAGTLGNIALVDGLLHGTANGLAPRRYSIVDHTACGLLAVDPHGTHEAMDSSVHAGFHPSARSNLIVERRREGAGVLLDAWAMGEQPPEAASTVLAGDDMEITLEPAAEAVLSDVREQQRRLMGGLAAGLGLPVWREERYVSYEEAAARAADRPGTAVFYDAAIGELDHECAGLELGGEHVDTWGLLRSSPGVLLAGPCLFPRAGAANPSLTTLALARYVVQRMD
ncbi:NAD(P)-binding protein [Streptomyces sp. NPDC021218]|uniref:NAD(P)-binding protein n=1 Tax=Streptomyces sp. NPDC021218 TaxID=3365119 RepID=UPI0037A51C53